MGLGDERKAVHTATAVIEDCYAAIGDATYWPAALTRLADYLGAVDATLEWHRCPGAAPQFFAAGKRLPQDGVAAYLEHYSRICPRIPYLAHQKTGSIGCDQEFISESEMNRDEFYNDFLAPDDLRYFLSGCIRNDDDWGCAFVAIHRSPAQGPATTTERRRLARILPHLCRAFDAHLHLATAAAHEMALLDTLECISAGALLFDTRGMIIHANDKAHRFLAINDGLGVTAGHLHCADKTAQSALHQALQKMTAADGVQAPREGTEVIVQRPSGKPAYVLLLRPFGVGKARSLDKPAPAALLFIHDPARASSPPLDRIAAVFGLTPSEATLVGALYEGTRLNDYAATHGIAITTARYHLYQAMNKLGVKRQSELVILVSRLT